MTINGVSKDISNGNTININYQKQYILWFNGALEIEPIFPMKIKHGVDNFSSVRLGSTVFLGSSKTIFLDMACCQDISLVVLTWWLIPLSKWVITPVINGISRVNPLITGVITHLLSGMSHQVVVLSK